MQRLLSQRAAALKRLASEELLLPPPEVLLAVRRRAFGGEASSGGIFEGDKFSALARRVCVARGRGALEALSDRLPRLLGGALQHFRGKGQQPRLFSLGSESGVKSGVLGVLSRKRFLWKLNVLREVCVRGASGEVELWLVPSGICNPKWILLRVVEHQTAPDSAEVYLEVVALALADSNAQGRSTSSLRDGDFGAEFLTALARQLGETLAATEAIRQQSLELASPPGVEQNTTGSRRLLGAFVGSSVPNAANPTPPLQCTSPLGACSPK